MRVSFDHAAAREFDLVIGADGLHSRVRQLVFGPDAGFELSLGYHVAAFEVEGYRPRDELVYLGYGVPGRQISRFSMRDDKTLFLFIFRDEYLPPASPRASRTQGGAGHVFAGVGWECPQILAAMERAGDIYFDTVSQIRMDRWTKGRHGAGRRCRGLRLPPGRRRRGTGDGRGVCSRGRAARRAAAIIARGLRAVRGAADAVSEEEAA